MPDMHLDTRTGRDKIRAVIRWANAAGFPNIAAELSNALLLIPKAEAVERLLATPAAEHEEIRRIAWLRIRLSSETARPVPRPEIANSFEKPRPAPRLTRSSLTQTSLRQNYCDALLSGSTNRLSRSR